jgi:hypothetical protein
LKKIFTLADGRKTRFHTENNKFIGCQVALSQTPVVAIHKLQEILRGRRRNIPWWPIAEINQVEKLLDKNMTVIEFGSGGSTIWLASRIKRVLAIEHNHEWAESVSDRLRVAGIRNCEVQHRSGTDYYGSENLPSCDVADPVFQCSFPRQRKLGGGTGCRSQKYGSKKLFAKAKGIAVLWWPCALLMQCETLKTLNKIGDRSERSMDR